MKGDIIEVTRHKAMEFVATGQQQLKGGPAVAAAIAAANAAAVAATATTVTAVSTSTSSSIKTSSDNGKFTLTSPTQTEGILISDYTCEAYVNNGNDDFQSKSAAGASPPLVWSNAPSNTEKFLMVMTSVSDTPDHTCSRYEWVLYNIDPSVTEISTNNLEAVGKPGGSFPGDPKYRYAAPCGWGGSYKYYTFTLYALSGDLYKKYAKKQDVEDNVWGDPSVLGPDLVKYALDNEYILDTASLTLKFCPAANTDGCTEPPVIVTENKDVGTCT